MIVPPTGSKADSISAADVPGAKLVPITTVGPELRPFMLNADPESRTVSAPTAPAFDGSWEASKRLSRVRLAFRAVFGAGFLTPEEEGWNKA